MSNQVGPVELAAYAVAFAQTPFFTVGEAAAIAMERKRRELEGREDPLETTAAAIRKACSRGNILSNIRGVERLLDVESFYTWLEDYTPQPAE